MELTFIIIIIFISIHYDIHDAHAYCASHFIFSVVSVAWKPNSYQICNQKCFNLATSPPLRSLAQYIAGEHENCTVIQFSITDSPSGLRSKFARRLFHIGKELNRHFGGFIIERESNTLLDVVLVTSTAREEFLGLLWRYL